MARRFTLTIWVEPDWKVIENNEDIRYFIAGKEICPDTQKLHWQSYLELHKKCRFSAIPKILKIPKDKMWKRKSKGTAEQNIEYCSKDKEFKEFGKPAKTTQGTRTDLIGLRDHFKTGGTKREAIESNQLIHPLAKYPRLVNDLEIMYQPERTKKTELYIYWGPTHTGKSHTAFEEAKKLGPVYFKPTDSQWWDGYEGQPCVILEDFRGEISLAMMLRLADKYPMRVQVKGGYKQFNSQRIYITSNINYHEWFNSAQKGYEQSLAAFHRRIDVEKYFETVYEPSE